MSKSDQWVNVSLVILILIYLSIWVVGYVSSKLSYLLSFLNLIASVSIILYWAVRQMQIKQHIIELREIIVLSSEVVVIGCAVYGIVTSHWATWTKVMQYVFFGIHLSALVLALIFMLTFKLNKLF